MVINSLLFKPLCDGVGISDSLIYPYKQLTVFDRHKWGESTKNGLNQLKTAFKDHLARYMATTKPKMWERGARLWLCGKKFQTYACSNNKCEESGNKKNIAVRCNNAILCGTCKKIRQTRMTEAYSELIQKISSQKRLGVYNLTLTIENTESFNKEEINKLQSYWRRFRSCKTIKNKIKGGIRSIEVTYNKEKKTYHLHLHIVYIGLPIDNRAKCGEHKDQRVVSIKHNGKTIKTNCHKCMGEPKIINDSFLSQLWQRATRGKGKVVWINRIKAKNKKELKLQLRHVTKYVTKIDAKPKTSGKPPTNEELERVFKIWKVFFGRRLIQPFGNLYYEKTIVIKKSPFICEVCDWGMEFLGFTYDFNGGEEPPPKNDLIKKIYNKTKKMEMVIDDRT